MSTSFSFWKKTDNRSAVLLTKYCTIVDFRTENENHQTTPLTWYTRNTICIIEHFSFFISVSLYSLNYFEQCMSLAMLYTRYIYLSINTLDIEHAWNLIVIIDGCFIFSWVIYKINSPRLSHHEVITEPVSSKDVSISSFDADLLFYDASSIVMYSTIRRFPCPATLVSSMAETYSQI